MVYNLFQTHRIRCIPILGSNKSTMKQMPYIPLCYVHDMYIDPVVETKIEKIKHIAWNVTCRFFGMPSCRSFPAKPPLSIPGVLTSQCSTKQLRRLGTWENWETPRKPFAVCDTCRQKKIILLYIHECIHVNMNVGYGYMGVSLFVGVKRSSSGSIYFISYNVDASASFHSISWKIYMSHKKKTPTFHYTGCLIGSL